ncbi:biopolymer transporter ExbD [Altererythrobacter xixiisoli]|uniref:Biopolymer transporter ExbD n=1 Tax=Croceibacterium xixiisoli TaxID=1476466 RepID=A0A6I4TVM7_9SPHN|nr:biopolymer transporter ExbD [Croceibacterium xixiisoli]MXP00117.1 biopolymer transporter ExbD [Croceibacterium xixiisoli]
MAVSTTRLPDRPMMEMNTTPLIDVLLVLLIMFIITIPVATHSVEFDLPQPPIDHPTTTIMPVQNRLILTRQGDMFWNGESISEGTLVANLRAMQAIRPEPELQFAPEANASYEQTAQVVNIVRATGVTKFGFVGNEQYREFGR